MARYVSPDGRTIRIVKDLGEIHENSDLESDRDFYIDGQPGEIFRFNILAFMVALNDASVALKAGWSVPAGTIVRWNTSVDAASGSVALSQADTDTNNSALASALGACCEWDGIVRFGATAGRVAFQWCRNAVGGSITELVNSCMVINQIR